MYPPQSSVGTGLVSAAVQQGKTMHGETFGADNMPVTLGYMRALYSLLYGPLSKLWSCLSWHSINLGH